MNQVPLGPPEFYFHRSADIGAVVRKAADPEGPPGLGVRQPRGALVVRGGMTGETFNPALERS